jgi:DNA polymerase-3 subunit alpha
MTKEQNKLNEYCKTMLLDIEIDGQYLVIDDNRYMILNDQINLIDEDGDFEPDSVFKLEENIAGFVYEFGGRWYTQTKNEELELNELNYIGKAKEKLPTKSFLGIRSGYELMNGLSLYKSWISKAKFLGAETLGICERNTLGGVLAFQNECKNANIKPIIGMSVPVIGSKTYDVKLYAKNFQGWLNLLKFNTIINVDLKMGIALETLENNKEGLFIIADPKSMDYNNVNELDVDFYQLDTVNFLNSDRDEKYIDNLELFIKGDIEPISITDAFYLESQDYRTREQLWTINKAFDDKTDNQYFKSKTQYAGELVQMFDKEDKTWISLFKQATANEQIVVEGCSFEYDTDTRHLPRYIMSQEESDQFNTNEELFLHLVKRGFKDRQIKDADKYIARLKKEIAVLKMGDVIDYFLSLHDIINYAKSKKMLTGIGRGSAGGSLVAYLMGIIQVDPLRFDLLFERFLNEGRMGQFEERPSFKITQEDGSIIEFEEGSLVRIKRNNKETVVFVHELVEGDDIIIY